MFFIITDKRRRGEKMVIAARVGGAQCSRRPGELGGISSEKVTAKIALNEIVNN